MKMRFIWSFMMFLTLICLFPINASAQSLVLIGEFFSNDTLMFVYQDETNAQVTRSFIIPEHLRSRIEHAENELLEAKQLLTTYYTLTEDQKSLNGIQNRTDATGSIVPTIQADFSEKFQADLTEVNAFLEEELKRASVNEEYKDPIAVETVEAPPLSPEESKQEESTQESKEKSGKQENSIVTIIGAISLIGLIGGSLYVISKRR